MTNEEMYLSNRMGHRNPFTVPEGYFDQLTERVMERVPAERPRRAYMRVLRPLLYAAACVCVVVLSVTVYLNMADEQPQLVAAIATESGVSDDYFDEAADYAMIDNQEIYACLMNE